ncbi:MAG: septum site-determining protein MinC [gamma proteobacterium symbiont of Bathyaustriella thionipta]|nr:septum site-determining protein MinC [gamma proteobacterium symbiont of Bathyaustriella thionipta]MCU7949406.1 septum site-determining protein MinC [gamma proteobacterium symbiont of Bathyaustriella thionipta]MCU7953611.1 septum site-determining protein MinC [gamma proteobacterium symbiont of Bathyaustriella thionipta]MCU7956260.1 septum site-determining protein MinC [gamma proteobacterium symbiont of Bathyaustriella thionipta]MCU7965984.1 septum site-determining protein MinC [gamma proteoba
MDNPCFELKGSLFTLSVLQLFENNLSLLKEQLQQRIQMAPGFFNHTPFVVDLNELSDDTSALDFAALKELLLSLSIIPVGVKGADKSLHSKLEAAGLAIMAETKTSHQNTTDSNQTGIKPVVETEPEPELESEPEAEKKEAPQKAEVQQSPARRPAKVVKQTIRSGQQIYAPGGDLVVIGSVSTGAEILADGNIHIYGTLRGRALAGVLGDQSAAIFCHCLQAELSSVAGIYLLSDDLPEDKIGASVQIYLDNEKLHVETI